LQTAYFITTEINKQQARLLVISNIITEANVRMIQLAKINLPRASTLQGCITHQHTDQGEYKSKLFKHTEQLETNRQLQRAIINFRLSLSK